MKARSEFTNRRSPGVVSLMKSFDGRVNDTGFMFQIACAAVNHPAPSPTRGSGEGAVGDMSGAPDSETPFIDDDRAQAPNAIAPSANDMYKALDFMGGWEEGGGGACQSARVVAQHQAHACDLGRLIRVHI